MLILENSQNNINKQLKPYLDLANTLQMFIDLKKILSLVSFNANGYHY